jgi:hypothetical protein
VKVRGTTDQYVPGTWRKILNSLGDRRRSYPTLQRPSERTVHRGRQAIMQRWFSAAEYDRFQKTSPFIQQITDLRPTPRSRNQIGDRICKGVVVLQRMARENFYISRTEICQRAFKTIPSGKEPMTIAWRFRACCPNAGIAMSWSRRRVSRNSEQTRVVDPDLRDF